MTSIHSIHQLVKNPISPVLPTVTGTLSPTRSSRWSAGSPVSSVLPDVLRWLDCLAPNSSSTRPVRPRSTRDGNASGSALRRWTGKVGWSWSSFPSSLLPPAGILLLQSCQIRRPSTLLHHRCFPL
uniref:Uncharacterized protein n=1 Tax=Cacopsylla melanoneura TaxID=428564 RepID=A0A8D8RXV0_9HEMI